MNAGGNQLLMQMAWLAPTLLAYLVIMAVAVFNWSKYPKPSLLVLCAVGLMFVLAVGQQILQFVIISQHNEWGIQPGQIGWILGMTGLIVSLFRFVALGLLVMAAYTGRVPAQQRPWTED